MPKYIVDLNLLYHFSLWNNENYIHVKDVNEKMTDSELWEYARNNNLTIITKDSDFSERILFNSPPPRIIHIKFGNFLMREFFGVISGCWDEVCNTSEQYKLVNVFKDRIEGIE